MKPEKVNYFSVCSFESLLSNNFWLSSVFKVENCIRSFLLDSYNFLGCNTIPTYKYVYDIPIFLLAYSLAFLNHWGWDSFLDFFLHRQLFFPWLNSPLKSMQSILPSSIFMMSQHTIKTNYLNYRLPGFYQAIMQFITKK